MSPEVFILLIVFVGLMLLNVPVAFCIGLATVATIATLGDVPTGYGALIEVANIPVGRVTLQLSYMGYEKMSMPNIEVNSGKEVVLTTARVACHFRNGRPCRQPSLGLFGCWERRFNCLDSFTGYSFPPAPRPSMNKGKRDGHW